MDKKILVMLSISLLACHSSYAKEPKNLDVTKASLITYHDSGAYQKDQAKVIDKAMQYLKTRVDNSSKNKKLAIILDIDETSLSNYADMQAMAFGGSLRQISKAEDKGIDPALASTLKLYRYAKAHNVAVFFITGRTEVSRVATEKNLLSAGYQNWDGLWFKDENYKEKSAAPYKIHARSLIAKQGYDIVLNVGDQQSDLTGGYADKTFKLPNPYYLIP